jgi:hypothetical protein
VPGATPRPDGATKTHGSAAPHTHPDHVSRARHPRGSEAVHAPSPQPDFRTAAPGKATSRRS